MQCRDSGPAARHPPRPGGSERTVGGGYVRHRAPLTDHGRIAFVSFAEWLPHTPFRSDGPARSDRARRGCLYAPQITGVASALDTQVRQVVGAAGWQGSAAAAFTSAWKRDSVTARAVGLASDQIAGIVGWLAGALSRTEAMLEDAANEARAHGVTIGADGTPPQACYAGSAQHWLSAYQKFYAECMQAAHSARQQAAGALAATAKQITDPKGRGIHVAGDSITAADMLADLLASPSATVRPEHRARRLLRCPERPGPRRGTVRGRHLQHRRARRRGRRCRCGPRPGRPGGRRGAPGRDSQWPQRTLDC